MLGKTGLKVSELCLGAWAIGGAGWGPTNKKDCLEAIRTMVDNGVNIIDTAPAYNAGVSEQIVGEAIKGIRDKVYVVTKTGSWYLGGAYVRTLKREKILLQCDMSLKNLGIECIDLYLLHWPDASVPIGETMDVLAGLKKQGKINHIGVSNFTKEMILEAEKYGPVEALQMQYSMVSRDAEDLIKWAHERGIGVMTYGSLGAGILSGAIRTLPDYPENDSRKRFYRYFEEPVFSKVMKLLGLLDEISAQHGSVPLAQIAINWNAQKPFVDTSLVGVRSAAHARENCAGMDWMLTTEEMASIDRKIKQELG